MFYIILSLAPRHLVAFAHLRKKDRIILYFFEYLIFRFLILFPFQVAINGFSGTIDGFLEIIHGFEEVEEIGV